MPYKTKEQKARLKKQQRLEELRRQNEPIRKALSGNSAIAEKTGKAKFNSYHLSSWRGLDGGIKEAADLGAASSAAKKATKQIKSSNGRTIQRVAANAKKTAAYKNKPVDKSKLQPIKSVSKKVDESKLQPIKNASGNSLMKKTRKKKTY